VYLPKRGATARSGHTGGKKKRKSEERLEEAPHSGKNILDLDSGNRKKMGGGEGKENKESVAICSQHLL